MNYLTENLGSFMVAFEKIPNQILRQLSIILRSAEVILSSLAAAF